MSVVLCLSMRGSEGSIYVFLMSEARPGLFSLRGRGILGLKRGQQPAGRPRPLRTTHVLGAHTGRREGEKGAAAAKHKGDKGNCMMAPRFTGGHHALILSNG